MRDLDLTKLFIGGFLILLGICLLVDQFFGINIGSIFSKLWPVFIMLIGIYIILRTRTHIVIGLVVFSIGGLLLADRLLELPFSIWNLWPLIIILVGLSIVFPNRFKFSFQPKSVRADQYFESTTIFWGEERKIKSDNLSKVKITAIFGGSELDFTESSFVEGATFEVVAIFGGSSLRFSSDVLVESEGIGVLGGFEDRTSKPKEPKSKVKIHGIGMFGGVEIKN